MMTRKRKFPNLIPTSAPETVPAPEPTPADTDLDLATAVAEAVAKALAPQHRTAFRCPSCDRLTDNNTSPMCRRCSGTIQQATTPPPAHQVARRMGWAGGYPADLLEKLGLTAAEALQLTQDELAERWDTATRHCVNPGEPVGAAYGRQADLGWRATPEAQRIYKSAPRPLTRRERAAQQEATRQAAEAQVRDRQLRAIEADRQKAKQLIARAQQKAQQLSEVGAS